ncbi:hypothetical protein ACIRQQ_07450 [Streptomyces fuscichromogenes]|uniref:hypothetical protein n=1 Tax=Streptomyces fuscichromogenes TaxID=1324013 RepID=UPI0038074977
MKACVRDTALALAVVSTAVSLTACGSGTGSTSGPGSARKSSVLLRDFSTTARWETQDRPLLEREIRQLCGGCTTEYANAGGDVATQQEQTIVDGATATRPG